MAISKKKTNGPWMSTIRRNQSLLIFRYRHITVDDSVCARFDYYANRTILRISPTWTDRCWALKSPHSGQSHTRSLFLFIFETHHLGVLFAFAEFVEYQNMSFPTTIWTVPARTEYWTVVILSVVNDPYHLHIPRPLVSDICFRSTICAVDTASNLLEF